MARDERGRGVGGGRREAAEVVTVVRGGGYLGAPWSVWEPRLHLCASAERERR
jgi:hypothetical protein